MGRDASAQSIMFGSIRVSATVSHGLGARRAASSWWPTGNRDDQFAWRSGGWRGALQYALRQAYAGSTSGGGRHGIEGENNAFGYNNMPRAWPSVCNVTLVGPVGTGTVFSTGSGAQLARGTAGAIANTIFMNWPTRASTSPMSRRSPGLALVQLHCVARQTTCACRTASASETRVTSVVRSLTTHRAHRRRRLPSSRAKV